MHIAVLMVLAGIFLLIKGADGLIVGATAIARRFKVPPIVIGLTIVAFGTSLPELLVNVFSVWKGTTDLAVGNIIGSNIANILLIIGVSAVVWPLSVKRNTVWKEIPFAFLASILVLVMASDIVLTGKPADMLDRIDGFALLAFFVIFLYYAYGMRSEQGVPREETKQALEEAKSLTVSRASGFIILGIAGLALGGSWTVDGAVTLATALGISERIIGLTVVAIGTSLPELVTSVMAALRRQADIAVGNVVGSNIFNVFWILGISASVRTLPFSPGAGVDALVAVAASFLFFVALFIGKRHHVDRWQGAAFVALYAAYLGSLAFRA
ncbi:calcium/sodium antiporter [Candidatus Uhrbacteria bacterium]|nr:calcium/sodium antiporter [Candidatus Uhrbacteria bacterium]